jgi:hypothetical protein
MACLIPIASTGWRLANEPMSSEQRIEKFEKQLRPKTLI